MELIKQERLSLDEEFAPDGYNVGVNIGAAGGQSILHVHMIPRYQGDTLRPQGGVRHVIPDKAHYIRKIRV